MNRSITLRQLSDPGAVAAFFKARDASEDAVGRRQYQFARLADSLAGRGVAPDEPIVAYFTPGRIEVLGKHTDYAGGRSVVCTVDRGFAFTAAPIAGSELDVIDAATGERAQAEISPELEPRIGHWSNYPLTVARRLARNFERQWTGARIAFISDLPPAAGLSSSSAFLVGTYSVLANLNDLANHPTYRQNLPDVEAVAEYLGSVENGYTYRGLSGDRGVGTFGGSEDQTAILCSTPGALKCFSYAPTRFERQVAWPTDYVFLIGSSGVRAEKTGAALQRYNDVSLLASEASNVWHKTHGGPETKLAGVVARPDFSLERFEAAARTQVDRQRADRLVRRVRHFCIEQNDVIPTALDALAAGDMSTFAAAIQRSQAGAEALLDNQIAQTIALARFALESGAIAATAFGAGFGGSVWAMAEKRRAAETLTRWRERYEQAFPVEAPSSEFFATLPSTPTVQIDLK